MRKITSVLLFLFFVFSGCNCTPAGSLANSPDLDAPTHATSTNQNSEREEARALVSYIRERTVHVILDCTPKEGAVVLGAKDPEKYGDGRGSGIIVSSKEGKSYIFTAAHVVELDNESDYRGLSCKVYIKRDGSVDPKGTRLEATIEVKHSDKDMAVLSVGVNLGVSTELELDPIHGESVWAVGYPVEMANRSYVALTVTKGVLSSPNVPVGKYGKRHRVTSEVYFGNSGGGLWTSEGKLIGIVTGMMVDVDLNPYPGYYYVTPVNDVVHLLKSKWKFREVFGAD